MHPTSNSETVSGLVGILTGLLLAGWGGGGTAPVYTKECCQFLGGRIGTATYPHVQKFHFYPHCLHLKKCCLKRPLYRPKANRVTGGEGMESQNVYRVSEMAALVASAKKTANVFSESEFCGANVLYPRPVNCAIESFFKYKILIHLRTEMYQ
jgi:hypothetical protein